MARLHVIYDPQEKISTAYPKDELDKFGMKIAVLSTSDDLTNAEITKTAAELACLLLEQIAGVGGK
jgi:hypothetical protein